MTSDTEVKASETNKVRKDKTTFFDRESCEAHVLGQNRATAPAIVPDSISLMDFESVMAGRLVTRILLNQGPGGFSLIESDVAPGTRAPRHKHNLAQVALIIEGTMRQGNRVLGPGDGYFTPPDQVYTFVAGPEGCRYVEFRFGGVEEITSTLTETDPARLVHES